MRILTVGNLYPPHLGGYELSWQGAVDALRARGHDARVLTTDTPPPPGGPPDPRVSRALRWYWRDHAWPRFSLRERAAIERHNADALRRSVSALRPDAVAWWSMGGMSLGLIERVRRAGLPAVGFVHDDWMVYGPQADAWQRVVRRLPARRGPRLGAAARWLFVSEATRAAALAAPRPARHRSARARRRPGVPAGTGERCVGLAAALRRADRPAQGDRHGGARAPSCAEHATLRIVGAGDDAHAAELRALDPARPDLDRAAARPRCARSRRAYADADAAVFLVEWGGAADPGSWRAIEAMAVGRCRSSPTSPPGGAAHRHRLPARRIENLPGTRGGRGRHRLTSTPSRCEDPAGLAADARLRERPARRRILAIRARRCTPGRLAPGGRARARRIGHPEIPR